MARCLSRIADLNTVRIGLIVNGQARGYRGEELATLPLGTFSFENIELKRMSLVEDAFWELLPKLRDLTGLSLADGELTPGKAELLGQLQALKTLRLTRVTGLAATKEWKGFPQLEVLGLSACDGNESGERLAGPTLENLTMFGRQPYPFGRRSHRESSGLPEPQIGEPRRNANHRSLRRSTRAAASTRRTKYWPHERR